MSGPSDSFDVVIAGGGPAGASAAIHLATRGARVLLVEQKKFPRIKLCGEFISPECLSHFARLGVTRQMMEAGGAQLAETIFYTRGGSNVSVPSEWFGGGWALGLSRAEMDHRLLLRAREVGVEVLEEARAVSLLRENGRVRGVRLQVAGDMREYGSLITIDATGRARVLARRIEKEGRASGQGSEARARLVAFKAHLENARGAEGICEIYFYHGGYGGLSYVEGGLSNLCFIASAHDVRACAGQAERVVQEIVMSNRRAAYTLSKARPVSEWLCVALEGFGRRELVPVEGLITVGDAASFIDPFTGSGMLMALESGEIAAEAISCWLSHAKKGAPFGALTRHYRALYNERFGARLRVCALLRRAAFAPHFMAEAAIRALSLSKGVRRILAQATRRAALFSVSEGYSQQTVKCKCQLRSAEIADTCNGQTRHP